MLRNPYGERGWNMTSNNDLHHYGVKGMKWGKLKKKLTSLRDSIRGRKSKATNTDKPLTKKWCR